MFVFKWFIFKSKQQEEQLTQQHEGSGSEPSPAGFMMNLITFKRQIITFTLFENQN